MARRHTPLFEKAIGIAGVTAADVPYLAIRVSFGDAYAGALAAGASEIDAMRIAREVAGSDLPINPVGDMVLGAYQQLLRGTRTNG
jgi:hypothetical protein